MDTLVVGLDVEVEEIVVVRVEERVLEWEPMGTEKLVVKRRS